MTTRTVLVFGASGFLGSQVVAALDADPRTGEVIRAGRRSGDRHAGRWVRHDLVEGGVDELAGILRETAPDAVVNCAGRLSGGSAQLVEANVLATARLVDAVVAEAPAARLVVLGSAAEYGVVPVGSPVTEDGPVRPVGNYGLTRLASTQLVRVAVQEGRLDGVALRVFNPIGPGIAAENLLGQAVARLREAVTNGADHIVLGPLGAHRDFVDVRDVAAAIAAAALADRVAEPVLNVGSGRAVLARDAVELLVRAAGFAGAIHETAPPPSRSVGVNWIAADLGRIGRCLGWAPRYDLETSIQACWG